LDVFQPNLVVKDIYHFTESETSHELPDKEETKLYYANRPSVLAETDSYQPIVVVKDIYHLPESEASQQLPDKKAAKLYYSKRSFTNSEIDSNSNNNDGIEETTNDEGIEVLDLDDEESSPKKDPSSKRTSKNNSSDADSLLDQFDNLMENILQNQTLKGQSKQSPKEHGQIIKGQKGNEQKQRCPTEQNEQINNDQTRNGQTQRCTTGQNGQINNDQTRNGQTQRCPTGQNGQEIKEQTKSGQKRNFQFQRNESNKNQSEKSKMSKLSTINKKESKTNEDSDSDIEEISLIDDDEDDLQINNSSLSNLGKKRYLANNSVKENESQQLVDEKTNEDFNLNRRMKKRAIQFYFPDSQLNEDYGSIDFNSNVFSENMEIEDYNDNEFRKPVFKVKKIKERPFKNVQITPRTSKDEAKFAKSKVTSTPIGGIEVPISKKLKTKFSLKPIMLESSDDETEDATPSKNDGNVQVISY
jgi:hypothetical protein